MTVSMTLTVLLTMMGDESDLESLRVQILDRLLDLVASTKKWPQSQQLFNLLQTAPHG